MTNRPSETLARTAEQLFFVTGMGRSGTSLLQAMLAAHPDVSMPPETKFYTIIRPQGRRIGSLDSDAAITRAVDHALGYWQIKDMELDRQAVHELVAAGDRSWDTIFLALLALNAANDGAVRIGEKTPGHLRHIDHLHASFPQARFVHIIRDPRAVTLSWINAPFASRTLAPRIRDWERTVHLHRRWLAALGPDRYLLVRYEELVADPEATLREVCRFVGLEFSQAMLSPEQRVKRGFVDRQMEHMANTLKPVFTSSIDKWKRELSPRQIALIERSLGAEMSEIGYEASGATTRLARLQLAGGTVADLAWRGGRWLRRSLS